MITVTHCNQLLAIKLHRNCLYMLVYNMASWTSAQDLKFKTRHEGLIIYQSEVWYLIIMANNWLQMSYCGHCLVLSLTRIRAKCPWKILVRKPFGHSTLSPEDNPGLKGEHRDQTRYRDLTWKILVRNSLATQPSVQETTRDWKGNKGTKLGTGTWPERTWSEIPREAWVELRTPWGDQPSKEK